MESDKEVGEPFEAREYRILVESIQVLSVSAQALITQQQPQPQGQGGEEQRAKPAPPSPPVAAEPIDPTSTNIYHKAFFSVNPTKFQGKDGLDKAKKWLKEIEKAFDIIELPKRLKMKFGTYMIVGIQKPGGISCQKSSIEMKCSLG